MSRLKELTTKYCSEGVEYYSLEDVSHYARKRIDASEVNKYTYVGVENLLQNKKGKTTASTVPISGMVIGFEKGDILIGNIRPYLRKIWLSDCVGGTNGDVLVIQIDDRSILSPEFLYYVLSSEEFFNYDNQNAKGAKMPRGDKAAVMKYRVPVPPIEIQREIVRILDNFTELITGLETELETELIARKKQYQYYLNHYYEQQSKSLVPIGSLGSLIRGKRFTHADATDKGVPCIHYGELYTHYGVHTDRIKSHIREELRPKMRYAHNGDVIIVGAGENNIDIGVGVAWEGDYDVAVHDACYILHHDQNSKYISYFLRSDMYHTQIKKYVSEGKICAISAIGLGKTLIPIPDIKEQNRTVAILEKLDTLYNDITTGILAEIVARKKQYEFYREQILHFAED